MRRCSGGQFSYSGGNGGGCVEVGTQPDTARVLVRDTKDRTGPRLGSPQLAAIRRPAEVRRRPPLIGGLYPQGKSARQGQLPRVVPLQFDDELLGVSRV